jgi:low temperature requirement protein LtrA
MYFHNRDLSTVEIIGYVTLIQLWWISVWGISYIVIEYICGKSKKLELLMYFFLMSVVLLTIFLKPDIIRHF